MQGTVMDAYMYAISFNPYKNLHGTDKVNHNQ